MFIIIKDYLIGSTIKAVIFTLAIVSITVGISVPISPASSIGTPTPDLSESDIQRLIKESESQTNPPDKPKGDFFKPKPIAKNGTIYDGFRIDDIVDLIYKQHNKLVSKDKIAILVQIVIDEAPNYGNPPIHVILAIINRESTWNSKAKSGSSYGPMQVHYRVWGDYCNLESAKSLYNPRIGVRCGLKVFNHYLEANNGNLNKTLQRYRGSDSRTNIRYARDVLRTANKIKTVLSS